MTKEYDYLVIGSGIAGMSFALKVAHTGRVALVCKTRIEEANTALAQGGVASVTNLEVDDFEKHIHDTMVAGDWLSDPEAVRKVVTGAPGQIRQLLEWGVNFDRRPDGSFDLHREGGHSEFRILHHADNTGFEIQRGLIEAVRANPNIDIYEDHFAIEIITQHHLGKVVTRRTPDITCYGAYILNPEGRVDKFLARVTLMATGGVGAVYQTTTNPLVATGDGIAMVYRAKGTVKDMEFIQFHPTALFHPGDRPNFLITEAMRGYGGILRNLAGERFMERYDPERMELAPRDVVARAIDSEMKQRGEDHVFLDVTHKDPEETRRHFPNIYAHCLEAVGVDVWEVAARLLGILVGDVEEHVVLAPLLHLRVDGAGHHVAGRQLHALRVVALHEALSGEVAQYAAVAAHGLRDQEVGAVAGVEECGGVELDELHVLHRALGAVDHRYAVAGGDQRVGGCLVDGAHAPRGHQRDAGEELVDAPLRVEDVGPVAGDVGRAAGDDLPQVVLRYDLDGEMVLVDVDVRVGAHGFY